jgi:hypothetical protein
MINQMPRSSHKLRLTLMTAVPVLLLIAGVMWWALDGRLPGGGDDAAGVQPAPLNGVPVIEPASFDSDGLALPKKLGSLRFAVIGDAGRGDLKQFDTAAEMTRWREKFDFSFVLMLGDNMYARGTPDDYAQRFERPYKALLDAGVVFYAANGNHDPVNILTYGPYNMNGNRYYWFKKTEGPLGPIAQRTVRFFAIDTVNLDGAQMAWLRRYMGESDSDWEICFYHHPLYTSGRYRFQSVRTRRILEPILVQFGADVALSGHEHFYERVVPQRGVVYFTSGAGGALRVGDIRPSNLTVSGFDTDTHFMLMEISGDELYFQTISRTGKTIDSGRFKRLEHPDAPPSIR